MKTEHKSFPRFDRVLTFDKQVGPYLEPLQLIVALTPSVHYPSTRLTLCVRNLTVSLTVQQAKELRDQLDAGIADVIAACPQMAVEGDVAELPKEMPRS